MNKLFRRTAKPIQRKKDDADNLRGWEGVGGEADERVVYDGFEDDGECYAENEDLEEGYTDAEYPEPETANFGEDEVFAGSEHFAEPEDMEWEYAIADEYEEPAETEEQYVGENTGYYAGEEAGYCAGEEGGYCTEGDAKYYAGEEGEYCAEEETGYYAGEEAEYCAEEEAKPYAGEEAEYCAGENGGDYAREDVGYYAGEGGGYCIEQISEEGYAEAEDREPAYAIAGEFEEPAEIGEQYAEENAEHYTGKETEYCVEGEAEYYTGEEGGYCAEGDAKYYAGEETEYCAQEEAEYYAEVETEYCAEEEAEYYIGEETEYCAEDNVEHYTGEEAGYYAEENTAYYAGGAEYYVGEDAAEYIEAENVELVYGEKMEAYADDEEFMDAGALYEEALYLDEEAPADRDDRRKAGSRKKRRGSGRLDLIDWVMMGTGAAVLILALVAGVVMANRRARADQVADFANVGTQLEGISIIGERGLVAVADAEAAKMEIVVLPEPEDDNKGYDETTYDRQISIAPVFTSVHKDLKIKFINQKTGKLVPNVPFTVTVTAPDGKNITWSDEDMDGIIYKKNIVAGNYQVAMEMLQDFRYADYTVSTAVRTAEVQEEIVYKPVDVANEVKQESEVNVAQEDTKQNETVVESILTDTVAWVESKVIGVTYNEIAKSEIPDPAATAIRRILMMTAEDTGMPDNVSEPSPNTEPEATAEPAPDTAAGATAEPAPDTEPEATAEPAPDTEPEATAEPAPDTELEATAEPAPDTEPEATAEPVPDVTPEPEQDPEPDFEPDSEPDTGFDGTLTLDRSSATVFLTVPAVLHAAVDGGQDAPGNVTAESSNTEVAQVSVSGWQVTVTGVNEGSAEIIVRYSEDGGEAEAVCTVTVRKHPREDTGTKLKDAAGNQLYVLENDKYREASHADYYQAEKFFLKGGIRYSGWQTIEGKIYYFTADGVKVTGEHIIQGAKYQFAADGALVTGDGLIGIDVSKWNGTIDWNAVKNSGISYVIVRSGYRGSSAGKLIEDPYFDSNMKGATAAGLKVGVYFYSQAIDEVEAVEEASMVLEQIRNYKITYPVFIDVERSGGRGDKIDNNTRTAVCKAFCQTIQNAGYTAGVYSNKLWMEQQVNMAELNAYKVWLAQYAASPTYSGKYDIWQYKANGSVSGVKGDVDLNISYLEH